MGLPSAKLIVLTAGMMGAGVLELDDTALERITLEALLVNSLALLKVSLALLTTGVELCSAAFELEVITCTLDGVWVLELLLSVVAVQAISNGRASARHEHCDSSFGKLIFFIIIIFNTVGSFWVL